MSDKILFVDDDPNLLASCERSFRKQFQLDTADGGEAGLAKIAERGPYAVVVSDRQMPRMDGIQFLRKALDMAPNLVGIIMTGAGAALVLYSKEESERAHQQRPAAVAPQPDTHIKPV